MPHLVYSRMTNTRCTLCRLQTTDPSLYTEVQEAYTASGIRAASQRAGLGEYAVRSHFLGVVGRSEPCVDAPAPARGTPTAPSTRAPAGSTPRMELRADGTGSIESGDIEGDTPVAWDDLIRILGGDPATTQVKNDTIRVSARTVYRDDEPVIIRSYGASLVPRDADADRLSEDIQRSAELIRTALQGNVTPIPQKKTGARNRKASFLIAWGDTQLGKSAGGGHTATVDRFMDAISRACDHYEDRVVLGYRYNEIVMPILGDIVEGVAGNYPSQLFTTTLNQADQRALAAEVTLWAVEYVRARTGLPMRVIFVNSNHGENSRLSMTGGGKNMTSASDTHDRELGMELQRYYRNDNDVEILVPGGNLVMTAKLNGIPAAFAHGHGIGPRAKAQTIQQELLAYDEELTATNDGVPFLPKLWMTAHYHHFQVTDQGNYVHIQTPALDGGSEWFTNQSGKWSRPGLVVATVGEEFEQDRGIADITAVFCRPTPDVKRSKWHTELLAKFDAFANNYGE